MEDKVLIIKQIEDGFSAKKISGVMRLEEENGYAVLHLSLINVPYCGGNYYAVLQAENGAPIFIELGSRPSSVSRVIEDYSPFSSPTACGLIYAEGNTCTVVGFSQEKNITTVSAFRQAVKDGFTAYLKENETPAEYDDEVVATENYYELDKNFNEKLDRIERLYGYKETETEKEGEVYSKSRPYYKKFEKELNTVFSSFIKEESLSAVIPDSEWIKINFRKEKYYVVGVVKDGGKPKYICYGVPSAYSETPPIELAGLCSFIPKSVFDLKGEGYFIIFQDAITGKCVKKPT